MTATDDVKLEPSGEPPDGVAIAGGSPEPSGPILYRASGAITDVRYPERTIEVIAHPYNEEAIVPWSDGRIVSEVCDPGAYTGIERRAARIHVNRDHARERACGRTVSLHPERDEGLVANLQLSRTPLGDETLELAADGVLSASVGYRPMPGGERWSRDRRQVHLTKCWLVHIALVPEPAYEGAAVLAVRDRPDQMTELVTRVVAAISPPVQPVATPNLDQVLAWFNSGRYGSRLTE
jgi:HK97 family phage prohead protease